MNETTLACEDVISLYVQFCHPTRKSQLKVRQYEEEDRTVKCHEMQTEVQREVTEHTVVPSSDHLRRQFVGSIRQDTSLTQKFRSPQQFYNFITKLR